MIEEYLTNFLQGVQPIIHEAMIDKNFKILQHIVHYFSGHILFIFVDSIILGHIPFFS